MKKRIPKVIDKKLRGEWAEMRFMVRIAELGIPISKPWGDSRSFDFWWGGRGTSRRCRLSPRSLR
jgi:hypothetical protein